MATNLRRGLSAVILALLFAPGAVSAQAIDCAAYANYAGAEPRGYAEACLGGDARPGTSGDAISAPTDTAVAYDMRDTSNTVEHQQGNLATQVVIGNIDASIFALDYSADATVLYAVDNGSGVLGTFDGSALTPVGTPTRPAGHSWSGLSIDPATGDAYLSSTNGTISILHSVDLTDGSSAQIGTVTGLAVLIDIAVNCEGVMYGHDIATDSIFTIDTSNGSPTLVGAHGLAANFAQGMDFDNDTGELYIYAYTGGGTNTYGTVDLSDGSITPLNVNNPLGEWEGASRTTCDGIGTGPARFEVNKDFDDNNTAEVAVTISCNTGLPLEQTTTITENDNVTFVVNDFEDGAMDCAITEVVPLGYTASYAFGEDETSDTGCSFAEVGLGTYQVCNITNALDTVEVEVTKVWIDENPQFNAQNVANANWSCSNISEFCDGFNGCATSGFLDFFGNPGVDSFNVLPDWDTGTVCSITEVNLFESGTEVDDSECQGLVVFPGEGASCTIYNTRLYEGIPTLSQYGLGILALLMLGMGFVAFRRVI